MTKTRRNLYDGRLHCGQCSSCNCPSVELHGDEVLIHDPDKPDRGKLFVGALEYNQFIERMREVHAADLVRSSSRLQFGVFTIVRSEKDQNIMMIKVPGLLEISLTMMTEDEFVNLLVHAEMA